MTLVRTKPGTILGAGLAIVFAAATASGQALISAKAGLIHYTEGDAKIGEQSASPNNGTFQSLAVGKELSTGEGRAEMLLGPGQFLRLNEATSVRMVSNKLDATKLEVVRGSVMLEVLEIQKGIPLVLAFGANTIEVRKTGLYRIDAAESRLRVIDGEAMVEGNSQTMTIKKGHEVVMGAVLAQSTFDANTGDEFSRWAQRRSGYIATANVATARTAFVEGYAPNQWAFNPWYGMYTYVPGNRFMMSPFGFPYFSPFFAFNDMFWDYLTPYNFGFYGMGFGYGYGAFGSPFGYGSPWGYGYGTGYGNGYGYGGGGGGGVARYNPSPVTGRTAGFGARTNGPTAGSASGSGGYGMPVMTRGGGGHVGGGSSGPGYSGGGYIGGGRATGGGGGNVGGGFSNGGGHSSGGSSGSVSSGGGGGHSSGMASGGGMSSGASAASSGAGGGARVK